MNLKITPFNSLTAVFEKVEIRKRQEERISSNLQLFKKLLEMNRTGLQYHPYTMKKRAILFYRVIFFLMGLFLSFLSIYISLASYNFIAMNILTLSTLAKTIMTSISGFLATIAFILAARLHPHREILQTIIRKAKAKAQKLYIKKIFFIQYLRTIECAEMDDAKTSWRFLYEDALEAIEEKKENASLLLERIYISETLNFIEKERLYNEAFFELEEDLKKTLHGFERGIPLRSSYSLKSSF